MSFYSRATGDTMKGIFALGWISTRSAAWHLVLDDQMLCQKMSLSCSVLWFPTWLLSITNPHKLDTRVVLAACSLAETELLHERNWTSLQRDGCYWPLLASFSFLLSPASGNVQRETASLFLFVSIIFTKHTCLCHYTLGLLRCACLSCAMNIRWVIQTLMHTVINCSLFYIIKKVWTVIFLHASFH